MLGESQIEAFTHTTTVAMQHSQRGESERERERERAKEGERERIALLSNKYRSTSLISCNPVRNTL